MIDFLGYNFSMDDQEFENLVHEAIDSLPKEFLAKMENVAVVIEDWPNQHQIEKLRQKNQGGLILGLYEGVPQTKRGNYGVGPTLPDKITIFKQPLFSISNTIDQLTKNVKNTVIHEIAHHFGLNDEDIKKTKNRQKK